MAHRSCRDGTACVIRKKAETKKISVRKAIKEYSVESEIPVETLDRWVWPRNNKKKSAVKNDGNVATNESKKNQLIIELNKKIGELYQKEEEYLEIEKKHKAEVKNNPDLQASILYAIILGAFRIIEKHIDLSKENKTASHIPDNKRVEFINRGSKISTFINQKLGEMKNDH